MKTLYVPRLHCNKPSIEIPVENFSILRILSIIFQNTDLTNGETLKKMNLEFHASQKKTVLTNKPWEKMATQEVGEDKIHLVSGNPQDDGQTIDL